MGKMERAEMKYPHMREELIGYLHSLADKEYQLAVWVRDEPYPDVVHDELDYAIHFIYDDTCLGSDPGEAIGWFLKNDLEAQSIRNLVRCLDSLFATYGMNLEDAQYIEKPEWLDVMDAASSCEALLLSSH